MRVWNVESRQSVAEFQVSSKSAIRSVRSWRPISAHWPTLVIGSAEREILTWHPLEPGKEGEPQIFASTPGRVVALHWSANGGRLAAAELNADKPIEVYA